MRVRLRRHSEPRNGSGTRRERSGPAAVHVRARPAPASEATAIPLEAARASGRDERRARTSGGPEDHALYRCHCGCGFHAPVSASVSCPRCGEHQAW